MTKTILLASLLLMSCMINACNGSGSPTTTLASTPDLPKAPEATMPPLVILPAPATAEGLGPAYEPPVLLGCTELIRNGGFETLFDAWVLSSGPRPPQYVSPPRPVYAGSRAMQMGIVDLPNIFSDSFVFQDVTLPSGPKVITVSFHYYPQFTSALSPTSIQYARVEQPSGGLQTSLLNLQSNTRTWTPVVQDISSLAGQTIRLKFGVFNDGSGGSIAMWVDNVSILVCPISPAASPSAEVIATPDTAIAPPPLPGAEGPLHGVTIEIPEIWIVPSLQPKQALADYLKTTVEQLEWVNPGLEDPVAPGTLIAIPATYRVSAGESLAAISAATGLAEDLLRTVNPKLAAAGPLPDGTVLTMPAVVVMPEATSLAAAAASFNLSGAALLSANPDLVGVGTVGAGTVLILPPAEGQP